VAKAIMVGQSQETAGGAYVDSRVTLKSGDAYDVRWKLVRRGGTFKVREAEVIGFEMTSFLNTLFQNYITDNGGNPRVLVIALNR
jgi:phospholipid transport system substrate-binding protein